jgi:hypothetical protein
MRLGNAGRVAALSLALSPVLASAQEAVEAPPPCAGGEYRQFDFWLGSWEVKTSDGNVAGTNAIDSILNGCVLREQWWGARGMTGTSFNTYDPHAGTWHQTWVDDQGGFLLLSGALEEGAMVLRGEMLDDEGLVTHRITWTPVADGQVRQLWEASRDGGATWSVVFDGLYARMETAPAEGD